MSVKATTTVSSDSSVRSSSSESTAAIFAAYDRPMQTDTAQPEAIADRLWPGRVRAVEPLGGGITNYNFKVSLDGETLVLRIGGKDTELLGIDRRFEHAASLMAAALGVGPEVVDFVEPEGYLV